MPDHDSLGGSCGTLALRVRGEINASIRLSRIVTLAKARVQKYEAEWPLLPLWVLAFASMTK